MKEKRLLDSFALLAYLKNESNGAEVKALLDEAEKHGRHLLMNEINGGEVYYIIAKERSIESADYFLHDILGALPIKLLPNNFSQVIDAAKIKSSHPVSYADAFAISTALREKATLVTGDPEFKCVEKIVKIEWL